MASGKERIKLVSSECTCLRLRKAARCMTQIYDQHLEPFSLTVTQFSLLGHVRAFDGIGIGALAEKLITDPTTLTRNLRPLERRDLLILVHDPNDRRSRRLHLTDKGREAYVTAKPAWANAQKEVEGMLGEQAAIALNTSLDHMLEQLAQ
jgi:DNA-binding MarR family transcriptional regulator